MGALLPESFYIGDALEVAEALLGKHLRRGPVVLRITEVEAYGPGDSASHCRMGRTPRNAPMWGPPGRAYVYLCYGIHSMLNLVTNPEGQGAAVLIRACEPVRGLATVRRRRAGREGPEALAGPGKVGMALELDTGWSGHPLFTAGGLSVLDGPAPAGVLRGPRVGIDYADAADRAAPLRLAVADSPYVTRRAELRLAPSRARGPASPPATRSRPGRRPRAAPPARRRKGR